MENDAAAKVQVVRNVIEGAFSTGDLSVIDANVAPDFVEHQRGAVGGLDGLKGTIRHLRGWFPDLRLTIEDAAVSGDTVWVRIVARATHTQPVMGRPPTGKPVQLDIIDICRVVDGKMVEHWGVPDQLAMMEQIGVVPAR